MTATVDKLAGMYCRFWAKAAEETPEEMRDRFTKLVREERAAAGQAAAQRSRQTEIKRRGLGEEIGRSVLPIAPPGQWWNDPASAGVNTALQAGTMVGGWQAGKALHRLPYLGKKYQQEAIRNLLDNPAHRTALLQRMTEAGGVGAEQAQSILKSIAQEPSIALSEKGLSRFAAPVEKAVAKAAPIIASEGAMLPAVEKSVAKGLSPAGVKSIAGFFKSKAPALAAGLVPKHVRTLSAMLGAIGLPALGLGGIRYLGSRIGVRPESMVAGSRARQLERENVGRSQERERILEALRSQKK